MYANALLTYSLIKMIKYERSDNKSRNFDLYYMALDPLQPYKWNGMGLTLNFLIDDTISCDYKLCNTSNIGLDLAFNTELYRKVYFVFFFSFRRIQ